MHARERRHRQSIVQQLALACEPAAVCPCGCPENGVVVGELWSEAGQGMARLSFFECAVWQIFQVVMIASRCAGALVESPPLMVKRITGECCPDREGLQVQGPEDRAQMAPHDPQPLTGPHGTCHDSRDH